MLGWVKKIHFAKWCILAEVCLCVRRISLTPSSPFGPSPSSLNWTETSTSGASGGSWTDLYVSTSRHTFASGISFSSRRGQICVWMRCAAGGDPRRAVRLRLPGAAEAAGAVRRQRRSSLLGLDLQPALLPLHRHLRRKSDSPVCTFSLLRTSCRPQWGPVVELSCLIGDTPYQGQYTTRQTALKVMVKSTYQNISN